MHTMKVMFPYGHPQAGHAEVTWADADTTAIQAAQAMFDEVMAHPGMTALAQGDTGGTYKPITKFDPTAKDIQILRPIAGG